MEENGQLGDGHKSVGEAKIKGEIENFLDLILLLVISYFFHSFALVSGFFCL